MANQYEINRADQIVDVRPWGSRIAETLSDPVNLAMAVGVLILLTLMAPMLMILTVPALILVIGASRNVSTLLPLRYPPETINPENKKKGDGIWFIGNMEFDTKKANRLPLESAADRFKEVWLGDDDMRKHLLILGSTGSGKSELLKGIFFCSLCWGSGFFVADGKADNKLPLDTFNMLRFFGRDDDYLALNFLLAGKTPEQVRNSKKRRTNKTNPFSTADADTIVQMGANLLPKVDGDAKNWQEKALNCWRGLVPALCWLRDNEAMEISVTSFVDYLALPKLEELYAKGYTLAQQNGGVWNEGFVGIKAYLDVGLPGFKSDRCLKKFNVAPSGGARPPMGKPEPLDQDANCYDQHGYRATQLNPALNLLDKTYGHIFQDKFSEIDMVDVTLNNRVLVLLIPSLEKSAQEAESLGKLTVACLRVMMGKNLGADIEGRRELILESKATEARYPYVVALDELGYYFADGIAVMFAQARSLGFAMIAAAQDIEKLTEGSRAAEAGAMLANQVTKIFMRIDDANKTNEMIQKYLGKVNVALKKTYEHREMTGFKRMQEVTLEEVPIATLQNLQGLGAGKAIINTMGQTFKVATFYVGSFLTKYPTQDFHINRFLQVRGFTQDEIENGIKTKDGVELISMPIDALNDKQVKGARMMQMMTGADEIPDIRDEAESAPYAAKHKKAVGMVNAVAMAANRLPANIVGAQRAIVLYRIARQYMIDLKDGKIKIDEEDDEDGEDNDRSPERATGSMISQGSGTGEGKDSFASPHEEDPFGFLNEERPLVRKPVQSVLSTNTSPPGADVVSGVVMTSVAELLKEATPFDVKEPQPDPMDMGELESKHLPLPAKLQVELFNVIDTGEPLDFSGLMPKTPRNDAATAAKEKAISDAQWIGRALAGGALTTKGDTVVGLTQQTKEGFIQLEKALGNEQVTQSTIAVEQLIAQQITPTPLKTEASGADFSDILELLSGAEASLD